MLQSMGLQRVGHDQVTELNKCSSTVREFLSGTVTAHVSQEDMGQAVLPKVTRLSCPRSQASACALARLPGPAGEAHGPGPRPPLSPPPLSSVRWAVMGSSLELS